MPGDSQVNVKIKSVLDKRLTLIVVDSKFVSFIHDNAMHKIIFLDIL